MNTSAHPNVAIGEHSVIDPSARIGSGSRVGPHVVIEAGVAIGSNTTLGAGAHVARGVQMGSGVTVHAGAVFALSEGGATTVGDGAVVGAGAVICGGVVIEAKALVRPGSVVTRSVPPAAIVEGNPANIVGYVDAQQGPARSLQAPAAAKGSSITATAVNGVTVHTFPIIADLRGDLTVGEFDKQIPFVPLRYFMVFGVPNKEIRGEHAHRECHQFLICVRGSCAVVADDGAQRVEVMLDAPNIGIHLPPMTWGVQYKYSADALLLVFASHHYAAADYIRDYTEFRALTALPTP